MKKVCIYLLALPLILLSCKEEVLKTKTLFDYLDISLNRGTNGITSVFIDSTKVMRVHITDHDEQNLYYQDTLKDSEVLKLNRLTDKALADNFDTLVGGPSCFSFPFYLIITKKDKTFKTLVYQDIDYSFKPLDSLTNTIILLTKTIKHRATDTSLVFNSRKKVLGPPPAIIGMEKFVPPVVKEN